MTSCLTSRRPLLIAIGPRAVAQLDLEHEELDLVDVAIVADTGGIGEVVGAIVERNAVVCLFDGRDEARWRVVVDVVGAARPRSALPLVVVTCDPRPAGAARRAMLWRLSSHLDVCVVDAPVGPYGLIRTALLLVHGLCRRGLTGFDAADLASVLQPPSVGQAAWMGGEIERVREVVAGASDVLLSMRCARETTLDAIEQTCAQIEALAPSADLLLATPWHSDEDGGVREVGVIAFRARGQDA